MNNLLITTRPALQKYRVFLRQLLVLAKFNGLVFSSSFRICNLALYCISFQLIQKHLYLLSCIWMATCHACGKLVYLILNISDQASFFASVVSSIFIFMKRFDKCRKYCWNKLKFSLTISEKHPFYNSTPPFIMVLAWVLSRSKFYFISCYFHPRNIVHLS